MMTPARSSSRRTQRLLAAACVFFLSFAAWADGELRLCPDCGRESPPSARFCASCGAAIVATGEEAPEATAEPEADGQSDVAVPAKTEATPSSRAASRDVARARQESREGHAAAALVLYRNAQALLAANAGQKPNEAATKAITAEAEAAKREFESRTPRNRRTEAMAAASRSCEDYFRGEGRIPCGRAWIPADWQTTLAPTAIAAVRLSLPPDCATCSGAGSIPCKSCGGTGHAQCRAPGCENGWVSRKPTNTLTPKTDIAIREKCPMCRGTAKIPCKACAGRAATPCKTCAGSGHAPLCKGCHGSGLATCPDCAKKGLRPDCAFCHGSGSVLCDKCGGDGRVSR